MFRLLYVTILRESLYNLNLLFFCPYGMLVACLVSYVMDLDYILCVSLCSPSATALVICGMILVLFATVNKTKIIPHITI